MAIKIRDVSDHGALRAVMNQILDRDDHPEWIKSRALYYEGHYNSKRDGPCNFKSGLLMARLVEKAIQQSPELKVFMFREWDSDDATAWYFLAHSVDGLITEFQMKLVLEDDHAD